MATRAATIAITVALLCAPLAAQESLGAHAPTVKLTPPPIETITRGKATTLSLHFQVESGYHVNSNQPTAEYLIPTALRLDPPTDIMIGKVTYPSGEEMSFAFAPDDKLSVYSGGFDIAVQVRPLVGVMATRYSIHGSLKYQACDKAACYPPKQLPVSFEIQVTKNAAAGRRNPAQSPHIHN
jgi:hypothetical protein